MKKFAGWPSAAAACLVRSVCGRSGGRAEGTAPARNKWAVERRRCSRPGTVDAASRANVQTLQLVRRHQLTTAALVRRRRRSSVRRRYL